MQPESIFILTGAGVSADSGLGTFRDKGGQGDGLWSQYRIEDVASIDGYERDPGKVLDFYNMRRKVHKNVEPNAAHQALALLQRTWDVRGGDVTLCTQNIDSLHEQGGAARVLHMHGEIGKRRCHTCGNLQPNDGEFSLELGCEACGRLGLLRPHVVWFGEQPLLMDEIHDALGRADLFVAIGTSGAVYPAANFVDYARRAGTSTLEINLEPSDKADKFADAIYGRAIDTVPAWVSDLIQRNG
jgi:NAD-dependent deacetylase